MKKILALSLALIGLNATMTRAEKYQYNEFYFQRSTLFEQLPVKSSDIVFFGNSLTNGCEWHELFNNPNVKNRGISSDVIQGLYDRSDAILKGKPRKIFILSGVNDVSHNLSADSIARAMEKLIVHIKEVSPKSKVYLQSLLPINNDFKRYKAMIGKEQMIIDVNAAFEQVAKRQGITWIDLFSKFADENGKMPTRYSNDGLHLLGAGYMVWRDAIVKYVNEK